MGLHTGIIIIIIIYGCFHPIAPICGVVATLLSITITQLHLTMTKCVVAIIIVIAIATTTMTITIVVATTIMGRVNTRH